MNWTRFFQAPALLALAAVLPAVFAGLVLAWGRARARRVARLAEPALAARLAPLLRAGGGPARAVRLGLVGLLGGAALAGPRWGADRQVVQATGVDLVLALDASLSMLAADERPSRLARMKQEVRRLRALAPDDRVALLAFAGRSYILSPLTTDAGALELFLDNLNPDVVGQAGSSLARAVRQGTELLQASTGGGDRAIVVMSDGEAFEPVEDVQAAAREAAAARIAVVTVGFGTEAGATIPVREQNTVREKRDADGAVVVTRYNPATLRAAAEAAGGTFVPAGLPDRAARVRAALAGLRGRSRAVDAGRDLTPRYQLFLAPALLLLLADTWLARRGARARGVRAADAPVRRDLTPNAAAPARAAAVLVAALLGHGALGACAAPRLPPGLPAPDADPALDAFRRREVAGALRTYRGRTRAGGSPVARYNLGTALAAADSLAEARGPLDDARRVRDPDLRFRALFNLGVVHLRRGLAGALGDANAGGQAPDTAVAPDSAGGDSRQELDAALAVYRQALLLRPSDADAKWNYELALRKRQGGGGGGGGGGGQGTPPPQAPPEPQPSGGVDRRQAEQLLDAAAREERQTQSKQQRRAPPPPPGGKDW